MILTYLKVSRGGGIAEGFCEISRVRSMRAATPYANSTPTQRTRGFHKNTGFPQPPVWSAMVSPFKN